MFPAEIPIGTVLTKEHIENITVEQLQNYHSQTFTNNNVRVFATGNVGDEIMKGLDDMMMRRFDDVLIKGENRKQKEPTSHSSPLIPHSSPLTVEVREGALQSSFILCRKNIGFKHEERRKFEVLSTLFGGYFGSRLMQNLREENGYTYGVFCSSLYYEEESIFYIEADVVVEKTKEAIDECFKEMELLQAELVDEEELSLVKSYMLGELLRNVDGSVSYQKRYAFWNDFQIDETELQQMIDVLQAMTPQTIQAMAKEYLVPEMFSTVVVGRMS
ncbi:MAG: insulinase family protein [Lentimicrobiaceae bacterium]|nr:insulinase family protein [Lentimicrobiaceae bacterium]